MDRTERRLMSYMMRTKCYRIVGFMISIFFVVFVVDISGVLRHLQEKSFHSEFSYPLEAENFIEIVQAYRSGEVVETAPINSLYSKIRINENSIEKCYRNRHFTLIILVKSAPSNFKQRQSIRETWKLSSIQFNAKVVFFVGNSQPDDSTKGKVNKDVKEESTVHNDIVLLDFEDSYYNNTIKTMLEIRWAVDSCPNFDYTLLVDDDYFVSIKNLLKFAENPFYYAKGGSFDGININTPSSRVIKLYAGYRMFPPPHRHKIMTKWFVPLEEYPYDYFPPYITAGAILLSNSALHDIYYASYYTTHFRFDDIYVAICAKKMNITPLHSEFFRFWTTSDESPEEFLIASHGFSNAEKLHRFWQTQRSHGYC